MKTTNAGGRFPDQANPPKPRWRDALIRLAAPATRIHRFKELQSAAVEDLLDKMDCGPRS